MTTNEQQPKPVTQYDMDYICKLCSNKYVDILIELCGCRTHTHCILSANNLNNLNNSLNNSLNNISKCKICNNDVKKIWKREDRIGRKWLSID